jgi:hypothetical protein
MGGVGKTQLAIEYAYRFAGEYNAVWWVAAEQISPVGDQFAQLAEGLGCAEPGAPLTVVQRTVLSDLRERGRWLLVFDNANRPEGVAQWLPGGDGHVLITSRFDGWDVGNASGGRDLARRLHLQWSAQLGPDDDFTLRAATNLAAALRELGHFREARHLDEDTLARRRRLGGDDDENTLISAHNLGVDLREMGEVEAARELDQDTLRRRRSLLGEDHPETLRTANSLAVDLYELEIVHAARELNEDTLARRRRVLGEDHSHTLQSANNLVMDLHAQGNYRPPADLAADTLARCRHVLGERHRGTQAVARNLADIVRLRDEGES